MSSMTVTPVFAPRHAEGAFARLRSAIRARLVAQRTRAALRKLSARELEDVGLTPSDIDRVARRVAGI